MACFGVVPAARPFGRVMASGPPYCDACVERAPLISTLGYRLLKWPFERSANRYLQRD